MMPLPNFMTIDLEEWYRANYEGCDGAALQNPPGWMERLTGKLLEICGESGSRCTFFVLGSVAEDFPQLIRQIADAGHEVASHGCAHKSVFAMTPREFEEDLRRSCGLLEGLSGRGVRGFRAPSFSVTRQVLPWFYDTLERVGLAYSSSVFPGKTFLYGIPDFPRDVHRPMIEGRETSVTEFPVTRVKLAGRTMGLYVRLFPASFLVNCIRRENAAFRPAMLYVHPREIDPDQPRLTLPRVQSFIHYFGVRGCEQKLRYLLRAAPGPFVTIGDALDRYPEISRREAA